MTGSFATLRMTSVVGDCFASLAMTCVKRVVEECDAVENAHGFGNFSRHYAILACAQNKQIIRRVHLPQPRGSCGIWWAAGVSYYVAAKGGVEYVYMWSVYLIFVLRGVLMAGEKVKWALLNCEAKAK